MLRAIRHRIEFFVFQAIVCLIDCLSPRATVRLAEGLAWFIHDVLPRKWSRYAVARENLRIAYGDSLSDADAERLVRGMWVHLFRTVAEIIQSKRKLHLESYRRFIHFADFTRMNTAMISGRRVIVLSGHFGNWEIGTALFGLWGFPMGVVAREMDNPHLHAWFREYRELSGHRQMLKKGDFDDMLAMLQKGGNLGLLCDQDAGARGLFVDFFGAPASTFKSIALLALEYDALVIVGYSARRPDAFELCPWVNYEVGCEILIDPRNLTTNDPVREITQLYSTALEQVIRRSPEQYFWVHRRWKSVPRTRNRPKEQDAKTNLPTLEEQRLAG